MSVVWWILFVALAAALMLALRRARARLREFRTVVRRSFPLRIYDLRLFRWIYHDPLLDWYLRAIVDPLRPTIVVTGDSTIAQMNLTPPHTLAGQLDYLASIRGGGRACRIVNIGVNGTAESYLDVSIHSALRRGAAHVLAGITIRDYTHVDEDLAADPRRIESFLDYRSRLGDFIVAGEWKSARRVFVSRLVAYLRYWFRGPDLLADGALLLAPQRGVMFPAVVDTAPLQVDERAADRECRVRVIRLFVFRDAA